jgi:hypothetical protein
MTVDGIRILEGTYTDKVISYTGSMLPPQAADLRRFFRSSAQKRLLHAAGGRF